MLKTNLCKIVYEFLSSVVVNSTAGRVDFGFLIRLPSLSMMPNLKASCF